MLCYAITCNDSVQIVFVHPIHNITILKYDTTLLGDTPVKALRFSDVPLEQGDAVDFVGVTSSGRYAAKLAWLLVSVVSSLHVWTCPFLNIYQYFGKAVACDKERGNLYCSIHGSKVSPNQPGGFSSRKQS